jgi:hypothetical protein
MALPCFFGLLSTENAWLLAFYSAALGACWICLPIMQTVPFELPRIQPREVAMLWAVFMVSQNMGTTVGPLFAGGLGEVASSMAMPLAAATAFMGFTIVGAMLLPETGSASLERQVGREVETAAV